MQAFSTSQDLPELLPGPCICILPSRFVLSRILPKFFTESTRAAGQGGSTNRDGKGIKKTAKQENRQAKPKMCCRTGRSTAVLHIRLHREVWSDLHCRGEVGIGEQRPGMVVEGEKAQLAEAFLLHRPHGEGFRAPEGMTLQQGRRTDGSGLARAPGKGPGAILIRPRGGRGLGKTPGC